MCLREAGYWSGLIGEQHVSADPADLGYDHVEDLDSTKVSDVAPAATRLIAEQARAERPFFLSVGFFETHREYFEPSSVRDALYSRPPENIVGHTDDSPGHGVVQSQRPIPRPGSRQRARGARRALVGRQHAGDPDHRPRPGLPRRQGDDVRPWSRGDADDARPRRVPRWTGPRCGGQPSRSVSDDLRGGGHRAAGVARGGVAAAADPRRARRDPRGGVRRGHVPRRLRTSTGRAHVAVQVHASLRRHPSGSGAGQRRRRTHQGCVAGRGLGRRGPTGRGAL